MAAVAAVRPEPVRAALNDVADPEDRLDVVDQGRPAEQADPGRERRPLAGEPALPLEALEHRRFLAADIRPGTPPQVDHRRGGAGESLGFEPGDLARRMRRMCGYSPRR